MNVYENLLMEADDLGLITKEKPLSASDGRIAGNKIAIRQDIETTAEKACVLAEELGHYHTSVGDIIDLNSVRNRKQERQARLWSYNRQIGLCGLIRAYERGCENRHEIAKFLNVTEAVLQECVDCYRDKYGIGTTVDNYYIMFIPNLQILKLL